MWFFRDCKTLKKELDFLNATAVYCIYGKNAIYFQPASTENTNISLGTSEHNHCEYGSPGKATKIMSIAEKSSSPWNRTPTIYLQVPSATLQNSEKSIQILAHKSKHTFYGIYKQHPNFLWLMLYAYASRGRLAKTKYECLKLLTNSEGMLWVM